MRGSKASTDNDLVHTTVYEFSEGDQRLRSEIKERLRKAIIDTISSYVPKERRLEGDMNYVEHKAEHETDKIIEELSIYKY